VVKGTRIPVDLVLEELAYNPDLNELFAAHPALTIEDVQACFAYANELTTPTPARDIASDQSSQNSLWPLNSAI